MILYVSTCLFDQCSSCVVSDEDYGNDVILVSISAHSWSIRSDLGK